MKTTWTQLTIILLIAILYNINTASSTAGEAEAAPDQDAGPETAGNENEQKFQTLDELFALYQPYLNNISAYEPIYFLIGTSPEKSKFQISLKYRLFNTAGGLARKHQWLDDLYIAYTQTAFWDLTSASRPFEDTSYKPEFFYRSNNLAPAKWQSWRMFLQTGFQHESNGRGGEFSRSTNFLYLQPVFILFKEESLKGLQIAPRIWAYVANEEENNPDLKDYRGYFDLEIKTGRADSLVLESHLRYAAEGASWQFDLTYPLREFLGANLDIYLQAQYVNSLSESLLNYRERTQALRLGISVVR